MYYATFVFIVFACIWHYRMRQMIAPCIIIPLVMTEYMLSRVWPRHTRELSTIMWTVMHVIGVGVAIMQRDRNTRNTITDDTLVFQCMAFCRSLCVPVRLVSLKATTLQICTVWSTAAIADLCFLMIELQQLAFDACIYFALFHWVFAFAYLVSFNHYQQLELLLEQQKALARADRATDEQHRELTYQRERNIFLRAAAQAGLSNEVIASFDERNKGSYLKTYENHDGASSTSTPSVQRIGELSIDPAVEVEKILDSTPEIIYDHDTDCDNSIYYVPHAIWLALISRCIKAPLQFTRIYVVEIAFVMAASDYLATCVQPLLEHTFQPLYTSGLDVNNVKWCITNSIFGVLHSLVHLQYYYLYGVYDAIIVPYAHEMHMIQAVLTAVTFTIHTPSTYLTGWKYMTRMPTRLKMVMVPPRLGAIFFGEWLINQSVERAVFSTILTIISEMAIHHGIVHLRSYYWQMQTSYRSMQRLLHSTDEKLEKATVERDSARWQLALSDTSPKNTPLQTAPTQPLETLSDNMTNAELRTQSDAKKSYAATMKFPRTSPSDRMDRRAASMWSRSSRAVSESSSSKSSKSSDDVTSGRRSVALLRRTSPSTTRGQIIARETLCVKREKNIGIRKTVKIHGETIRELAKTLNNDYNDYMSSLSEHPSPLPDQTPDQAPDQLSSQSSRHTLISMHSEHKQMFSQTKPRLLAREHRRQCSMDEELFGALLVTYNQWQQSGKTL